MQCLVSTPFCVCAPSRVVWVNSNRLPDMPEPYSSLEPVLLQLWVQFSLVQLLWSKYPPQERATRQKNGRLVLPQAHSTPL